MMKKLLTLLLILGLASLASATLQISVNGNWEPVDSEIGINPSDHVVLDIWTDADIPASITFALAVTQATGTIAVTDTGSEYVGPTDGGNIAGFVYNGIAAMGGVVPGEEGVLGGIGVFGGSGVIAGGGLLLFNNIDFHCEGGFDAVLHLYLLNDITGQITSLEDTVIIHQPEPMTIALLGLGGLFLRRRK